MIDLLDRWGADEARSSFSWEGLWSFFDGDEDRLNIAHECIDRHDPDRAAARIADAEGGYSALSFGELSRSTAQFAHLLEDAGIAAGERVGIMLEPSAAFYTALFGTLKRGAVAVPLYTLFGPDSVRDRLDDCGASALVVDEATAAAAAGLGYRQLRAERADLEARPSTYRAGTAASDPAVLQYTSGTTRQLPEAVPHDHRAIVTLMRASLFALGLAPGDRYFCPSSPAWGHGLWHGTIAPWSLGIALGAYAGRFAVDRLIDALVELRVTNFAAASTVYRMLLASGRLGELSTLEKASYTGEELDASAQRAFREVTGVPVCGMYGTTETGVILANYPGFPDYEPRPGALGKPLPGCEVAVLNEDGSVAGPGITGEISVRRRARWFGAKDLGSVDEDGYFHYGGRADDVIISAGWTISPLEVERALLAHPRVDEAAVVGVPDAVRGQLVKAFVVADGGDDQLAAELQERVRSGLGAHEYPRLVEFVDSIPKTPNGKADRRTLRARG